MGKIKVKKEKNFELKKQNVLTGSRVLNSNTTKNRIEYFIDNVESNLSLYWKKKILIKKNYVRNLLNIEIYGKNNH